jgi:hypothetical protein
MRVSQGWLDADSLQQTSECRDVHVECAPVLGEDYPSVLRRIKDHRWRDQYGYIGFSRVVLVERFEASGATLDPARRIFAASGIALLLVDDLALDGRFARALFLGAAEIPAACAGDPETSGTPSSVNHARWHGWVAVQCSATELIVTSDKWV